MSITQEVMDALEREGKMVETPHEIFRREHREKLEAALALPLPRTSDECGNIGTFDPWEEVLHGIHGSCSSECDDTMAEVLEAVRDRKTFDLIERKGFAAEFMLYILSGHYLTDYGMSPRGGWPDHEDLWQPLIDKWKAYRDVARSD
ncbi:hypothetical protein C3Y94_028045 [Rhizobium ruizarguesonis]|uniref:hypothetical protein n=1 Tax=Rhizobium ruizarguesonis TaxID=2081791 RepID=UPI001639DAA5|nr:hypothetical protein [Rhizobium ruizarguesonis]MBC2806986.1 hypothetical protein [Rhizobium ruizarguesonis]